MTDISTRVRVFPDELDRFARAILEKIGFEPDACEVVAQHLVESDLVSTYSHGVALLPWYEELVQTGQVDPSAETKVIWDAQTMVGLDGGFGVGQRCAGRAAELAIERAREYGLACVVGRNAGHIGRLGHYTSRLARAGFASILSINYQGGGQEVAPYGGAEGRLSNDPISIGAPASGTVVVADMALTNAAFVKVLAALDRGQSAAPEGWLLDATGAPTTDLRATEHGGTLVPLGGPVAAHKGYGLIVLFDILTGALSGGGVCRPGASEEFSNAFCLLAIDVTRARPRSEYDGDVEALRAHVKTSSPRGGSSEIFFPGELEATAAERQQATGIEIEQHIWRQLAAMADRLGTELPSVAD